MGIHIFYIKFDDEEIDWIKFKRENREKKKKRKVICSERSVRVCVTERIAYIYFICVYI